MTALLLRVDSLLRLTANEVQQACRKTNKDDELIRYISDHSCKEREKSRSWHARAEIYSCEKKIVQSTTEYVRNEE